MDIALGRCAEYVKQVKVFSPKSLAVKKGETKKQQIAYLYTDSEEMAKVCILLGFHFFSEICFKWNAVF